MKKMSKLFGVLLAVLALTGCANMTDDGTSNGLEILCTSRDSIYLFWEPVEGATEYVLNTTTTEQKWEPLVMEKEGVEFITDDGETMCGTNVGSYDILYDQIYKISITAKNNKKRVGSSVSGKFAVTYVEPADNHLTAVRNDDNIIVKWNNIDHGNGGKHQYGGLGIRYALYKQEGTIVIESGIKTFQPDEGYENGVLISKDFKPSSDYANQEFTYADTEIMADKSYRYFVIPYNDYNWVSDKKLTIKTDYSMVDWIE